MYSQFFQFCVLSQNIGWKAQESFIVFTESKKTSNRHEFQMLLTCLKPDLEGNTSKIRVNISDTCFVAWTCSEKKFIGFIFICVPVWALILLEATGKISVVSWDQECSYTCQCLNYVENSDFSSCAVTETN